MKISVIIPVYNSIKYLSECVDSVLNQRFSSMNGDDVEIILVDDGSTDGSEKICDDYAINYPQKIKVIHQKNSGPAISRKVGVIVSGGEFISFIDSDDWIDEDFLETLYREAIDYKADFVTAYYTDVYTNGRRVECANSLDESRTIEGANFIYEIHGSRNITTGPYPKLIKRELFEGIDFHEEVTIGEDYCMILQILENLTSAEYGENGRMRILKNHLYYRRMHGNNISRQGYTERHKKALDNYISVRNELIKKYPQYEIEIKGYHIEYELAVITAMCRNKRYDKPIIKKLSTDLKFNMADILKKCHIPLYYKGCCVLIAYVPWLFIFLFRILHLVTGR